MCAKYLMLINSFTILTKQVLAKGAVDEVIHNSL